MFKNENTWDSIIVAEATAAGIPPWVLRTTIAKESSFDPRAGAPDALGGSFGLGQLTRRTAQAMGYSGAWPGDREKLTGIYDPPTNIRISARYLGYQRRRFPRETWDAIYAAYNSGAPRRDGQGRFENAAGLLNVEKHVGQWRKLADYFKPGWSQSGASSTSSGGASSGGGAPVRPGGDGGGKVSS